MGHFPKPPGSSNSTSVLSVRFCSLSPEATNSLKLQGLPCALLLSSTWLTIHFVQFFL